MAETVFIVCAYCGKTVEKRMKNILPRLKLDPDAKFYCNSSCSNMGPKLSFNCGTCGKSIERIPSGLKKSKSGLFFCNKSCAAKTNKPPGSRAGKEHPSYVDGRSTYRGSNLKNKCEDCGESRAYLLIVHHRNGNRTLNEDSNLETLCWNCHALRHLVLKDNKISVRWNTLTSEEAKEFIKKFGIVA